MWPGPCVYGYIWIMRSGLDYNRLRGTLEEQKTVSRQSSPSVGIKESPPGKTVSLNQVGFNQVKRRIFWQFLNMPNGYS